MYRLYLESGNQHISIPGLTFIKAVTMARQEWKKWDIVRVIRPSGTYAISCRHDDQFFGWYCVEYTHPAVLLDFALI